VTVVVGLVHGNGVLLGADSVGVNGHGDRTIRADPKVFNLSQAIAVGYTSSFRMGQLLRYHLPDDIRTSGRAGDHYEWAVCKFVPAVRAALKSHGYAKVDNNVETGGAFLLAVYDRLFRVESDFQVAEAADCYDAVGAGGDVALGALAALRTQSFASSDGAVLREVAELALKAACHHNVYCAPPFVFAETQAGR